MFVEYMLYSKKKSSSFKLTFFLSYRLLTVFVKNLLSGIESYLQTLSLNIKTLRNFGIIFVQN